MQTDEWKQMRYIPMVSLQNAFSVFVVNSLFLALAAPCVGENQIPQGPESDELLASSPFTGATFTYSQEPEKTLIFTSTTGMERGQDAVGLYGDERLVFKTLYGGKVAEKSMVRVSSVDIERLLRICADYGLAEWDMERVQSKILEENSGEPYTETPSDAPRVMILISLDDYERGDYKVPHLERKVRFRGASFANRRLPPILEIRGIVELKRELFRLKKVLENQQ